MTSREGLGDARRADCAKESQSGQLLFASCARAQQGAERGNAPLASATCSTTRSASSSAFAKLVWLRVERSFESRMFSLRTPSNSSFSNSPAGGGGWGGAFPHSVSASSCSMGEIRTEGGERRTLGDLVAANRLVVLPLGRVDALVGRELVVVGRIEDALELLRDLLVGNLFERGEGSVLGRGGEGDESEGEGERTMAASWSNLSELLMLCVCRRLRRVRE